MSISHTQRVVFERNGIALMRSGSYVVPHLNKKIVDGWHLSDFKKHKYPPELYVVVVNYMSAVQADRRGKLAKFAFLSEDKTIAKYFDDHNAEESYIPLSFIKAKAYTPGAFLKQVKDQGETIHIKKLANNQQEWSGMLFGSVEQCYSSLVVLASTSLGFDLKDLEFKRNNKGYNDHILVKQMQHPAGMSQVFQKHGIH